MKITDAKPIKKSMLALYIDGEHAVDVDKETFLESRFSIGGSISDEELLELLQDSNLSRAKSRAVWLLSSRDYTKKSLFLKLKKDYEETAAQRAVERMEELGLLDDEEYARRYASDLLSIKLLSKRAAVYKLVEKGIDKDLAEAVLGEIDADPKEQVRELVERKYAKNLGDEKGKNRAVSALQRKGYAWEDIKSVLDEFLED